VPIEIFDDAAWQMSLGERAAVEGVLAQLRPALAIEIGSADGACLQRIAAHAGEVHSFDLVAPGRPVADNVALHTGDSHRLLPAFLHELADAGRNVDFVMVDGDHTPEGLRRDLEDLLDSRAVAQTVILIHDTANERVRSGVDAVHFKAWPKVAHVELDWIPGQLFAEPALRNELWYGLGLVLVDAAQPSYRHGSVYERRYHPAAPLLAELRQLVIARDGPSAAAHNPQEAVSMRAAGLAGELAEAKATISAISARLAELQALAAELERALADSEAGRIGTSRVVESMADSLSWQITAPLRAAVQEVRRLRHHQPLTDRR
jgi:hypothetical protein